MAAKTLFQAEKCCHLVSAHATSAWHKCSSVCQFLVHSTLVLAIFFLTSPRQHRQFCRLIFLAGLFLYPTLLFVIFVSMLLKYL